MSNKNVQRLSGVWFIKKFIANRSNLKKGQLVAVMAAFALIGGSLLLYSKAATIFVSTEPETGARTGDASVVTDNSASGGQAVRFGSSNVCSLYESQDVTFPADANITNVKNAPYSAKGDGTTDDTAALRQAFADNDRVDSAPDSDLIGPQAPRVVYLPAGTYMVSDSLLIEGSTIRITGAGTGRTVLKLKNNAGGFANAGNPKYMMKTGSASEKGDANAAFSNYVQNLTIDVGSGNPGAVGLRFDGANVAALEQVSIRSSDANKAGARGLTFETNAGPLLVKNLQIDGFDTGIYFGPSMVNDITFSGIRLTNQRQTGIVNEFKVASFEDLTITNAPLAIKNLSAGAVMILMTAEFSGKGSGPAVQAAEGSYVYARDVTSTGFSNIITTGTTARFVAKDSIREWASDPYYVGSQRRVWTEDNAYVSLRLPIKKAPVSVTGDLATWANVKTFGATPGNTSDDDGPAIQRAIDSGKATVYLPYGKYIIKTPIIVRGSVTRVEGLGSIVQSTNDSKISVGNVQGDSAIVENISSDLQFEHNSPDTVVFRNISSVPGPPQFTTGANATGDLFIENTGPHSGVTINRPINAWIRQLNRERGGGLTISGGATVWNHGNNVEDAAADPRSDQVTVSGESKLELIGGTFDDLDGQEWPASGPAVHAITNSYASIIMPAAYGDTGVVGHWISDSRDGSVIGNLTDTQSVHTGSIQGSRERIIGVPLYTTPGYTRPTPWATCQ